MTVTISSDTLKRAIDACYRDCYRSTLHIAADEADRQYFKGITEERRLCFIGTGTRSPTALAILAMLDWTPPPPPTWLLDVEGGQEPISLAQPRKDT